MNHTTRKAPAGCDPARGKSCKCSKPCNVCHCNQSPPQNQAPVMVVELRALMQRYIDDLQPYASETGERVALAMVDCCSFLLIEADRMEKELR